MLVRMPTSVIALRSLIENNLSDPLETFYDSFRLKVDGTAPYRIDGARHASDAAASLQPIPDKVPIRDISIEFSRQGVP